MSDTYNMVFVNITDFDSIFITFIYFILNNFLLDCSVLQCILIFMMSLYQINPDRTHLSQLRDSQIYFILYPKFLTVIIAAIELYRSNRKLNYPSNII